MSTEPAVAPPQNQVIQVRDLRTHLVTRWGTIKAVDGVSFSVAERETLGLVGESGSGKSMTCLSMIRLVPRRAARILGGSVLLGVIHRQPRPPQGRSARPEISPPKPS